MGSSGKGNSASRSASSSESTTTYEIDNSITTGDFGAIGGAIEVSKEALELGRDAVEGAQDLSGRGLDFASDVTRDGFDYASGVNRDSLDFAGDALARVADLAEQGNRDFIDAAGGLVDRSLRSLGDLAMQTSASTDDRVAKVATVAFIAAAAAFVLPAVFRRS